MGKTADLAMDQKKIIDTLHKDGKSQRVITERGDCSQSAVSKHIKCKVDWKEEIGLENVHKQQGVVQASQGVNWSWSQCIKSHHAPTSSGEGLLSHFWNRNNVRSMLSGLRRKITGLLLSGPKSSFQIKVNFPFHLEIKVWRKSGEAQYPSCLKSSVKFPQSVMIWGAVASAGVGPLRFIKSKVNVAIYHEISEHFKLPFAGKLYGDADFLFQQDFSTCPQGQTHFQVVCWPWIYWSA